MEKIRVKQIMNYKGNYVLNQFIIYTKHGCYFQSYDSIIAYKDNNGNVTLDKNNWDYSRTTGKYRNLFLHENKSETRKKIENGTYKLDDLTLQIQHM